RRTYARPPNDAVKPGTGLRSHRDHPRCGMFRNPARPSGHARTSSELHLDLSARWPADGWTDPWHRPALTSELPLPAGRNARLPGAGGYGPGPWRRAGSTRAAQRLFPRTGGAGFPRTDDRGAPDRATWLRPARRPPHPADAPRLRPRWRAGRFPARHGAHARARARPCPRPVLMARPAALPAAAVDEPPALARVPGRIRRAMDGIRCGAWACRAAAGTADGAPARAHPRPRRHRTAQRRRMAPAGGRRLFPRGRDGRAVPLPARAPLLPVDDGTRPPRAPAQPAPAACAPPAARRRGIDLLLPRRGRIRTTVRAECARSRRRAGALSCTSPGVSTSRCHSPLPSSTSA